jgi:hypothetical protein
MSHDTAFKYLNISSIFKGIRWIDDTAIFGLHESNVAVHIYIQAIEQMV